jgi:hypothetical protein
MANYLYNGIELPALPEWDKEKCPHAAIIQLSGVADITFLIVSSNLVYKEVEGHPGHSGIEYDLPVGSSTYVNGTWGEVGYSNPGDLSGWTPVWCNKDIYKTDGTLYLAASEPVPKPTGNLEFIGTYGGVEKGRVKIEYIESYDFENDITTFKITSISAKITGGVATDYYVNGKIEISASGESIGALTFSDFSIDFPEKNKYYQFQNTDKTPKTLEVQIPKASEVKNIFIKLLKTKGKSGFLFSDEPIASNSDWNILESAGEKVIALTITNGADDPDMPPASKTSLNTKVLFMGWQLALLTYCPWSISQMSKNYLTDINGLILKTSDRYYLIPKKEG